MWIFVFGIGAILFPFVSAALSDIEVFYLTWDIVTVGHSDRWDIMSVYRKFEHNQPTREYDLNRLPYDLHPVDFMVGRWELYEVKGRYDYMRPPEILDFGINPIPRFGARALNITAHYMNVFNKDLEESTMFGFMPVKNATRYDPRYHCALVTTYSNGINMIEQGLIKDGQVIKFHLKQFMRRRFGNVNVNGFVVDELERQIRVNGLYMYMDVQTLLTHDDGSTVSDDFNAIYSKIED